MNQFVCELDKGVVAFTEPGEGSLLAKYLRKCMNYTLLFRKIHHVTKLPKWLSKQLWGGIIISCYLVIFHFHECHVIKWDTFIYLIWYQLEKLEAAKAAWLVCLSLLSLTGPFLALLGLTEPYSLWKNLFRNEFIPDWNESIPDRNEFTPDRNEIIPDGYWNLG